MFKIYLVSIKNFPAEKLELFGKICDIEKNIRTESVVGNALAKYAVKETFNIPIRTQIFNKTEKPYLIGFPNIHFNISHSGEYVVCIVSDKEVGIDIQKIRPFSKKAIEYIGCKNEADFFSLWTKKEAEVKRKGKSIFSSDIKNLKVSHVKTFRFKDYYISYSFRP